MGKRVRRTAVIEASEVSQVEALLQSHGLERGEGTALVAMEHEAVVGVAVLRLAGRDGEVVALVTDARHRHRGIARTLVLEMKRRARDAGCQRLRVRLSQQRDAAITFFLALGFEQTHLALDLSL